MYRVALGSPHLHTSERRVARVFGLSLEDAFDKNDWKLRIKRQPAYLRLPEKLPLKQCLYRLCQGDWFLNCSKVLISFSVNNECLISNIRFDLSYVSCK